MLKLKHLTIGALAVSASVLAIEAAQANTVNGTTWEVATSIAQNAILANVPPATSTGGITWIAPSDPLFFNSDAAADGYTLGGFIATGGGTVTSVFGTASVTDSLNSTITEVRGTVTVTTGETFNVGHDDGFTLQIAGWVFTDPGPSAFASTPVTYTGPTGNESFELAYGECCGPPAVLLVDLPLVNTGIPEPSTWAMMVAGFAGLGFAAFRRGRKTSAVVA